MHLYPLKTSENLTVLCFHGLEKGCLGTTWVKQNKTLILLYRISVRALADYNFVNFDW